MRYRFQLCRLGSFTWGDASIVQWAIPRAIRLVSMGSLMALCGFSHAAPLQLMSVKEDPPGTVTATVGVYTGGTPSPSQFQLRFDERNELQAKEVKSVNSSMLETSVILSVDRSGSMGRGGSNRFRRGSGTR